MSLQAENWDKPVAVSVKVNHNLSGKTSSQFLVTAGNIAFSWTVSLGVLGIILLLIAIYNRIMLPHPAENSNKEKIGWSVYKEVFVSFFSKPGVIPALIFFLLYRLGESQLVKVATPFLVDSRSSGGIGLTSAQYGIAYGTIGMICLTLWEEYWRNYCCKIRIEKADLADGFLHEYSNKRLYLFIIFSAYARRYFYLCLQLPLSSLVMDSDLPHICFICFIMLEKASIRQPNMPLVHH